MVLGWYGESERIRQDKAFGDGFDKKKNLLRASEDWVGIFYFVTA